MQTIEIQIETFGAIERLLPKTLAFEFSVDGTVKEALDYLVGMYPAATQAMEKCACAIGEDIVDRNTVLATSCTLVLLSPVAGG